MKQASSILAVLLVLALLAGLGAGCAPAPAPAADGRLQVVTTIFPVYDWVRNLAGDRAEVTMLLDSGVDLHSYQPTVQDMLTVGTCDVFIYVGGVSDGWVADALAQAQNPDMVVVNLLQALGGQAKEEEVVEGMQAEEEEEAEGPAYDEHVWLSLKNARTLCGVLAQALTQADPEGKEAYAAAAAAYDAQLADLDARYAAAVEAAPCKTLLFGDRFPFRYLADDYGLDYYAAFVGCSAETEASFETIAFLAGKVDQLGLRYIMQIESADGKLSATVRDTTQAGDQEILTLDSLQSVTRQDVEAGTTYLGVMEENLEVLTRALSAP